MTYSVVSLGCPNCGAPVSTDKKKCEYCDREIIISGFNTLFGLASPEVNKYATAYRKALSDDPSNSLLNSSLGMCYMKLGLYDKSIEHFSRAIDEEQDNPELLFYSAICRLRGKRPFHSNRMDLDRLEENLKAAILLEPKGLYHYLLAYVKYDYHERKGFKTNPRSSDLLVQAISSGLSRLDMDQLHEMMHTEPIAELSDRIQK